MNFTKNLGYGSGSTLRWLLNKELTANISISNNFTVKRYSPANLSASVLDAIKEGLNGVEKSVKKQIMDAYNSNFTSILNSTLAEE